VRATFGHTHLLGRCRCDRFTTLCVLASSCAAGGVYIDANNVLGTGSVTSNGGNAEPGVIFGGMGGSGGRILLRCKGMAIDRLPSVAVEATGGLNGNGTGRGAAGTIYNQNCGPSHLVPTLSVDNGVTTATVDATSSGVTLIDVAVGSLKRLSLSGGARVALVDLGTSLRFTQTILAMICNRTAAQTSAQSPTCVFEMAPRWNESNADRNAWTLSMGVVHGVTINVPAYQLLVLGITHVGSTLSPAPGTINSIDPVGEAAVGFGYLGVSVHALHFSGTRRCWFLAHTCSGCLAPYTAGCARLRDQPRRRRRTDGATARAIGRQHDHQRSGARAAAALPVRSSLIARRGRGAVERHHAGALHARHARRLDRLQ